MINATSATERDTANPVMLNMYDIGIISYHLKNLVLFNPNQNSGDIVTVLAQSGLLESAESSSPYTVTIKTSEVVDMATCHAVIDLAIRTILNFNKIVVLQLLGQNYTYNTIENVYNAIIQRVDMFYTLMQTGIGEFNAIFL